MVEVLGILLTVVNVKLLAMCELSDSVSQPVAGALHSSSVWLGFQTKLHVLFYTLPCPMACMHGGNPLPSLLRWASVSSKAVRRCEGMCCILALPVGCNLPHEMCCSLLQPLIGFTW